MASHPPIVGITCDLAPHPGTTRLIAQSAFAYVDAVAKAGGVPFLLPPMPGLADRHLHTCDAFVLTGGDDPKMEAFGKPTHPLATTIHPQRQEFELRLIKLLGEQRPDVPVLGVCLGMQLMSLAAGAEMNQYLPGTLETHADHWDKDHAVKPIALDAVIQSGTVHSKHKQAIVSPGSLTTLALSHDDVIEAVGEPRRRFYIGVQWHPERTTDAQVGSHIFEKLIASVG